MTQQNHLGKTATTIANDGQHTIVTYHATQIVKFNNKEIILNSGGWKTQTTKTRMNQASNQFGLGYRVFQENFYWFIQYKNKMIEFQNNMKLKREPTA